MRKFIQWGLGSAIMLCSTALVAQSHQHTGRCYLTLDDEAAIKERMMENRTRILNGDPDYYFGRRSTTYIPITLTSVANSNGVGFATIDQLLAMVCDLNTDYLDQNIQFYIKDSIRWFKNDNVYNDAWGSLSSMYMVNNKRANTLNIYVSPTINNPVASFYSPAGDYVFMMNSMADGSSNTATHEVGHFFTLPHTFYGWEGTAYHDSYQGVNAPTSVNGTTVEKVARTGTGANCSFAADGFCDTEADYISDRWQCPYVGQNGVLAKDPTGATINPDEELYMSYYYDQCVTKFSAQQKTAIAADVQRRGWSNLAAPAASANMTGQSTTAIAPINGQVVAVSGSNNITLEWNALAGADMYVVKLERTLFGTSVGVIFYKIIYGATSYTFSSSLLPTPPAAGHDYRWTVRAMNRYSTCNGTTTISTFRTMQPTAVNEATAYSGVNLNVAPNPVENGMLRLLVESNDTYAATVRIYALDGRMVLNQENEQFAQGANALLFDVSAVANGTYLAVVTTEKGTSVQKFVIQH